MESESGWQVLSSEVVCDLPHLKVTNELVATPTRPEGVQWCVAHRRKAAIVAPRTPEGKYILIRQERAAIQRTLWEFPAGQIDAEFSEEEVRATALRELGEETGSRSEGELIDLGHYYSSAGFTDECGRLFLATRVVPREEGSKHDEHEAILETREVTAGELNAMVAEGKIIDANTLATVARLHARGLFE